MITSLLRVVAALFALTFIVAACASESGAEWTFDPTVVAGADASESPAEPAASAAPAEPAAETPAESAAPEPEATSAPASAAGEARVIELQADGALRFTDATGEQVRDIAVTPGETVTFRIDNTAGFPHNFYIGEDSELMTPAGSTDTGIPDWATGVQELEWVVPDDIADLKFGCTVPGHYALMQGTFSLGAPAAPAEPAEPAAETPAESAAETPAESAAPEPEATSAPASAAGEARVIELQADGALRFTDATGEQVRDIAVTPGETVTFRIDNTAGFPHNFYIGEDSELMTPAGSTDTGIPDWATGVQELEWVVPDDIADLKFGCTVPGHYALMQGTFSLGAPAAPAEPAEPAAETPAESAAETPAESAAPEPEATSAPASAAGEARVIELQADGALRFTDATGEQVRDIAVTPGETVTFRIDNTAGFPHNFYIGEDSELMTPAGSTDTGIPDWATGVQELEWVVPDDIADLKFGCTVPGHYALMQGTFSLGAPAAPAEPAEPAAETPAESAAETPAESAAPEPEATSAPASAAGEARVIELQADGALRFTDATGEQVRDIAVTPGETVTFRIDNTAGFPHNFYIGEDSELMTPAGSTDTGIPDWATGVQELEWVVPDDIADLKFGCTVPGHYALMQGAFSVSP